MLDELLKLLADLTGEPVPFPAGLDDIDVSFGDGTRALGYSQLNELLLLAGLDRVHETFFAYLLAGTPAYTSGSGFESFEQLREGVDRFRKLALMLFGNVKFAFKTLSRDPQGLESSLADLEPIPDEYFTSRHDPVLPVEPISPDDAYLTGYIVGASINERLKNAEDKEAVELAERRKAVTRKSVRNQEAYYASDHMDVYVATSMRERHEFVAIQSLTAAIFEDPLLKHLKLRWFDPTQALCLDRIDKGLAEALMLKRANCTIYLAQVTDTLGKDSELASTLAQGKPVVAYVPEITKEAYSEYLSTVAESEPDKSQSEILFNQLQVFDPTAAWKDTEIQSWLRDQRDAPPIEEMLSRLFERIRNHYDRRAGTLKEDHPLGIQVNLRTGVANGVLVARTPNECARLVHGILTRTLQFHLEESDSHLMLREEISKSIFRVATKDAMLTNTFWNFYLSEEE